jgi:hypothetical protein
VEAFGLDGGKLYLDTPKNHERRSVPLSAFLIDELTSRFHEAGVRRVVRKAGSASDQQE